MLVSFRFSTGYLHATKDRYKRIGYGSGLSPDRWLLFEASVMARVEPLFPAGWSNHYTFEVGYTNAMELRKYLPIWGITVRAGIA